LNEGGYIVKPKKLMLLIVLISFCALLVFTQRGCFKDVKTKFKPKAKSDKNTFVFPKGKVYGIDVSRHQGHIDWSKVKRWQDKPLHFVYIKASEGKSLKDVKYDYNIREAKKHGLLVGSYHFYTSWLEPVSQFEQFKTVIKSQKQDLIPMLDLEHKGMISSEQYRQNVLTFSRLCEKEFGCKPLMYSLQSFYRTHLKYEFNDCLWFMARYSKNPPVLDDGKNWTIWQFSCQEKVEGIDTHVDLNVMDEASSLKKIMWTKN
jgi:lysozyme